MTPKKANSHSSNAFSRCCHAFASGQRCRLPVFSEGSHFCPRHAKLPQNQLDPDDDPHSLATLTAGLTAFDSAAPIHEFLSRLLLLLGQNRISPRRAAVLAYISNQLLRTLSAMQNEAESEASPARKLAPTIIWDIPGPAREREHQAEENSATRS